MITDDIHILPTCNTPEFIFSNEGIIKIKGRGVFGNNNEVTVQIFNSPQPQITPSAKLGDFYFQITEPGLPE